MTAPGPLGPAEREALDLAQELYRDIRTWMERRGVNATTSTVKVSPFVDPAGQPGVVIQMNAYLARAIVLSFAEERAMPLQLRHKNGTFRGDR